MFGLNRDEALSIQALKVSIENSRRCQTTPVRLPGQPSLLTS